MSKQKSFPAACAFLAALAAAPLARAQSAYLDQLGPDSSGPILPVTDIAPLPLRLPGAISQTLVQTGNNNQASASSSAAGTSSANMIQQSQLGDGNTVQATQQGIFNVLIQSQLGNNNPMAATQLGANNVLAERQYGNNTTGLSVTQYAGAHATVTQSR